MRRLAALVVVWLCCAAAGATGELAPPQRLLKETADSLLAVVKGQGGPAG